MNQFLFNKIKINPEINDMIITAQEMERKIVNMCGNINSFSIFGLKYKYSPLKNKKPFLDHFNKNSNSNDFKNNFIDLFSSDDHYSVLKNDRTERSPKKSKSKAISFNSINKDTPDLNRKVEKKRSSIIEDSNKYAHLRRNKSIEFQNSASNETEYISNQIGSKKMRNKSLFTNPLNAQGNSEIYLPNIFSKTNSRNKS
jgi:hypothetical protein